MMKKGGKSERRAQKGGMGAADFATKVYGDAAHQMAAPARGNEIAMHPQSGGKKNRRRSKAQGGTMIVDLAVPTVLLGVQQYMKPASSRKGGKRGGNSARKTQRKK